MKGVSTGQFGMDPKPYGTICNKKLDSGKKKNPLGFSLGKPWLIIRIAFFNYKEMNMNLTSIFKNSLFCKNWFSISLQRELFISKEFPLTVPGSSHFWEKSSLFLRLKKIYFVGDWREKLICHWFVMFWINISLKLLLFLK